MQIKTLNAETDETKFVSSKLNEEIEAQYGPRNPEVLNLVITGPNGEVIGGLKSQSHWGWLYITQIWIEKTSRKRGYLSQMLEILISEAQKKTWTGIYLDTFDIKTAEIYQKIGFKKCGEIPNFPNKNPSRIYLYKPIKE